MKPLSELDHYEVLEVAPGADRDELERAWRLARSTYDDSSLAVYSVYGEDEVRQIRERIDEAWQVLSNAAARSAYDTEQMGSGTGDAAAPGLASAAEDRTTELPLEFSLASEDSDELSPDTTLIPAPLPGAASASPSSRAVPQTPSEAARAPAGDGLAAERSPIPSPPPASELEVLEDDTDPTFDGPRLRRSRLHRGLDIEHIARVTKINPTYLRFIEDERFDDLPAPVYVRGFVNAFARCIGLDAEQAAGSYMERFQASRVEEEPPRQRGRRRR